MPNLPKEVEIREISEINQELIELTKKLGITHIYSHDDHWEKYNSGELEAIELEAFNVDLFDFLDKHSITLDEKAKRIISNLGFTILKELMDSEIKLLKGIIDQCLIKLNLKRENRVLQSLDNLFKEIEHFNITIVKKSEKFSKDDVPSVEGKILFLLDMNMEYTSGSKDVVIESIFEIKEARPDSYDIVIVYSHEKLDFYEDPDAKADYVEQYLSRNGIKALDLETDKYLFLLQLWSLSKTTQMNELSHKLVTTLMRAAFGYSLHDYLELKIKSIRKAMLELIKINEKTFEFLFKDSFAEGELFIDILDRTQKSILNKVETEVLQLPDNKQSIDNLFAISSLKNKRILDEIVSKGLKSFRLENRENKASTGAFKGISEYGLLEYTINDTYKDIMTGDIFRIVLHEDNKLKYGILITTDCDLLIRYGNNIDEKRRNVDTASLMLFDGFPFDSSEAQSLLLAGKGLWPLKVDDNYVLIDISSRPILMNLNIKVLDLCSLDINGWATINPLKKDFMPYKTYFYKYYFETEVLEWLSKLLNIDEYFKVESESESEDTAAPTQGEGELREFQKQQVKEEFAANANPVMKQIVDVFVGLKYFIKINHQEKRFEARRIGRLDMKRTLQIIQTNQNINTRIGVPTNPFA